jgi:hypothetical protein
MSWITIDWKLDSNNLICITRNSDTLERKLFKFPYFQTLIVKLQNVPNASNVLSNLFSTSNVIPLKDSYYKVLTNINVEETFPYEYYILPVDLGIISILWEYSFDVNQQFDITGKPKTNEKYNERITFWEYKVNDNLNIKRIIKIIKSSDNLEYIVYSIKDSHSKNYIYFENETQMLTKFIEDLTLTDFNITYNINYFNERIKCLNINNTEKSIDLLSYFKVIYNYFNDFSLQSLSLNILNKVNSNNLNIIMDLWKEIEPTYKYLSEYLKIPYHLIGSGLESSIILLLTHPECLVGLQKIEKLSKSKIIPGFYQNIYMYDINSFIVKSLIESKDKITSDLGNIIYKNFNTFTWISKRIFEHPNIFPRDIENIPNLLGYTQNYIFTHYPLYNITHLKIIDYFIVISDNEWIIKNKNNSFQYYGISEITNPPFLSAKNAIELYINDFINKNANINNILKSIKSSKEELNFDVKITYQNLDKYNYLLDENQKLLLSKGKVKYIKINCVRIISLNGDSILLSVNKLTSNDQLDIIYYSTEIKKIIQMLP